MRASLFDPYRLDARLAPGPARGAVKAFERRLAELTRRKHCLLVSSGRDALKAALRAAGAGKGSVVAMTDLTHPSAPEAAEWTGARPLFVDIAPGRLNVPLAGLRAAAGKADALLLTHMFSASCGAAPAERACAAAGIPLIEDASQIIGESERGRPYGSFGAVSVFSLSPYKPVSCPGVKAGALLCDDDGLFEKLLRAAAPFPAPPARAAAHLLAKLDSLPAALASLGRTNAAYRAALGGLRGLTLPLAGPRAHEFPLLTGRRDALAAALAAAGVPEERRYEPFHLLYRTGGRFPASSAYAAGALHLPAYPLMTSAETDHVIRTIQAFFRR